MNHYCGKEEWEDFIGNGTKIGLGSGPVAQLRAIRAIDNFEN